MFELNKEQMDGKMQVAKDTRPFDTNKNCTIIFVQTFIFPTSYPSGQWQYL